MKRPLITLTSDFGVQSQGVGIMEGTMLDIAPEANVVHLMHGLPDYDIICASRTMETVKYLPVGYHVCVVDPGVGTKRRAIIIRTKRGDYLIGPDNGVLISAAANILGGCDKIVEITNPEYMVHPVSPIFHGRSVFAPAAAYLAIGIPIEEFGKEIKFEDLAKAPYNEAIIRENNIEAQIIHINKYGSLHLNILHAIWDKFSVKKNETLTAQLLEKKVELKFGETFGDVGTNEPLILKDDYGRIEIAVNMGNFSKKYGIKIGDKCIIKKSE